MGRELTVVFACLALVASFLVCGVDQASAQSFTVNVQDQNGTPVSGFKWLLEKDNTHDPAPGVHKPVDTGDVRNNTLAISLHNSHAPVVASGVSLGSSAMIDNPPPGRYFISVLPHGNWEECNGTYDMGGAPVRVPDQTVVTVFVRQNPIETAQVSIKVFHDISPLNNAPDPSEAGLPGFTVTLSDQLGDIIQDVFGNKLGTTYVEPVTDPCNPEILQEGSGDFFTDANGEVFIKNLAPNKYGIQVEPPAGQGWHQVTTIEGTKTIDAWVRPGEPPFLPEFGPPFWHAFYGFVKEMPMTLPGGVTDVSGNIRKGHLSRPPDIAFFEGPPPESEGVGERCLVGLNTLEQGTANAVFVGLCEEGTGNFTISNVPPGTYQLVIWDVQLLHIISFNTVIVNDDGTCGTGGSCNLGNITTPMWFGQHEHYVFSDNDGNGMRSPNEVGIPEQNVNLRYRDGTIYQAFPTDTVGFVPFQSVFPLFHWYVAEVDFTRFKATGLTVTNDLGGPVTMDNDGEGKRNPDKDTQTGPVLTQAFQVFAGQNQRWEWGKTPYGPGENGGISGIVFYATTRAEDDPRFAAGDPWEPGIPRVQVNLYKDVICNSNPDFPPIYPVCPGSLPGEFGDGIPDEFNGVPGFQAPDVDNHPLENFPGPEDIDNGIIGAFNNGDALRVAWTDSWDDNLPEGCGPGSVTPVLIHGTDVPISQCAEGLRTWNQARPGVFDGGYAFGPHVTGDDTEEELPPGTYIVETIAPPGYKVVKEEDRNVDFGPTPTPAILPARCVGALHTVPQLFSFLTTDGSGDPLQALPGIDPTNSDNHAPFAGDTRSLCDRKRVDLGTGQNAAADFFLFTDVPKAARAVGIITDDFANELAPGKPSFTEKFSPPWITIAVFDYTGKEIFRTTGDEFGAFNFLAPSTYAINLLTPSGVGPKMHHFCLNHPGPISDPASPGQSIIDPKFRPQYSTTCYTFNFEAGRTVYLDTPVIRTAAFVGALQTTLDCELPDGSPVIRDVLNIGTMAGAPAYIAGNNDSFTITSVGVIEVPNPAFPGGTIGNPADPPIEPEKISRSYGFGSTEGTVMIGAYTFPASAVTWANGAITVNVPADAVGNGLATGQLTVIKVGGVRSLMGVTLTVGATEPATMMVRRVPTAAYPTIQAALDVADRDDLILVDPGVYSELPILYERVRIQGAGAWSTLLDAKHYSALPPNPVEVWREKLASLVNLEMVGLLPEQDPDQPDLFFKDGEAPGFLISPNPARADGNFAAGRPARIDGFSIQGADVGGAIYVNAFANRTELSNLRLINNHSNLGGGIRVGNPVVGELVMVATSPNPAIQIHNNHILMNGSLRTGGGVAIYRGASNYRIEGNSFCGNFARSGGGGIAHRGLSNNGTITRNDIVFNEVFQGDEPGLGLGIGGGGGGIEVAGDINPAGGLTEGAGGVTITRNLIQGNLGGAADGGGVALRNVNGADANPGGPATYLVAINNNVIVNNVTGLGGGGLALQDAVRTTIERNTIANNDSTATGVFAFLAGPANPTTPQVAGIISRPTSAALFAVTGEAISIPDSLARNILWQNRSWYWDPLLSPDLQVATPQYQDLTAGLVCSPVAPNFCISTNGTNPNFTAPYFNTLTSAAAADEGGNFVQVYYTPLGRTGNYNDTIGTSGPSGGVGPGVP